MRSDRSTSWACSPTWPESITSLAASWLVIEDLVLDLVPEEKKLRQAVEQRGKEIVNVGIYSMIILCLLCAIFVSQLYFRKLQIDILNRRFEPMRQEAKSLEVSFRQIQTIRNYLIGRGKSVESLTEIYRMLPPEIYLSEVKFENREKFAMKGSSLSRDSIFTLVGEIEKSTLFKNVQTKYVSGRTEEGKEFSDFEIVTSFE